MPIVSVTPLGSAPDGVGSAIGQIIDYLERGSRRPQPNASIVGYYADTPTTAGVWRGREVDGYQLTGPVHTEKFRTVLEANHPLTTETLVSAVGSSGRADPTRSKIAVSPTGEPGEILSTEQVAALLGVSERYVRKVAAEVSDLSNTTRARLVGVRADGRNAAVAYLEDHAVAVRRGRGAEKAHGVWAASYRHLTNRNLEPCTAAP